MFEEEGEEEEEEEKTHTKDHSDRDRNFRGLTKTVNITRVNDWPR